MWALDVSNIKHLVYRLEGKIYHKAGNLARCVKIILLEYCNVLSASVYALSGQPFLFLCFWDSGLIVDHETVDHILEPHVSRGLDIEVARGKYIADRATERRHSRH